MVAETTVTRFGRLAVRMAAVLMFALVVLGMTARDAGAEQFPGNVTVSQGKFVRICKQFGGTPTRVTTGVVKCSLEGMTSVCNFKTMTCVDTIPFTQPDQQPVLEGAVILDAGSATSDEQPSAGTTRVSVNRGTIVSAEDDRSQ